MHFGERLKGTLSVIAICQQLQERRIVRFLRNRGEKSASARKVGVDFLDKFAVRLGFVAETLPLRIVLEGFPVGGLLRISDTEECR
jgi:hypothetical protein